MPKPTPGSNFTACTNKLGGSWTFGTTPSACNVSPAQSTAFVNAQYNAVIYKEGVSTARKDYMNEMYAMAKEAGTYYIKRRNPKVSQAEINGFLAGFFTLMNQETFWTHYRKGADSITRYMRGDELHGYGLMQVDDRSHSVALNQGKGVDLIENIVYGLDIYYAAWVKTATASCISSPTDYKSRARGAWSAYNGGTANNGICRFANPKASHAQKDKDYLAKFDGKAWMGHITNTNLESALNVSCLAEGVRPCALKR
ncbi:MAG: hypothetical protein EOP11_12095 [Proteobacteria bacterium]|nr:MAG: hypothetical protein EOP11_12095 [Pseudomonadota bacterium]